jgi:hypothetical protein
MNHARRLTAALLLAVSVQAVADDAKPSAAAPKDDPKPAAPAPDRARDAAAILENAIRKGAPVFDEGRPAECAAIYAAAAQSVLDLPADTLGPLQRKDLRAAVESKDEDASARAWTLRRAFDRLIGDLRFEPRVEAPLPEGFPGPGPVGRIVVKEYPRYRAARAEGRAAFMTLFQHIQTNEVKMTAPVEMTMDASLREVDMSFLYEAPTQGEAGRQGAVAVLDLEPVKVVSMGLRGSPTQRELEAARDAIREQLARDGWREAGPWRRLGYNSPMVPVARRYWEIQVPVTR